MLHDKVFKEHRVVDNIGKGYSFVLKYLFYYGILSKLHGNIKCKNCIPHNKL